LDFLHFGQSIEWPAIIPSCFSLYGASDSNATNRDEAAWRGMKLPYYWRRYAPRNSFQISNPGVRLLDLRGPDRRTAACGAMARRRAGALPGN
jgi:hypothetical protein